MVAYAYRPGYGFPGDVTRHLFAIEAKPVVVGSLFTDFGQAVLLDGATGGIRPVAVGDVAVTEVFGILVRSFPMQASSAPGPYGQTPLGAPMAPPHPPQPADVLRMGHIMVRCNGTPLIGAPAFVWADATAAPHTLGTFEVGATAGKTIALGNKTVFNSAPDANGMVELAFNI